MSLLLCEGGPNSPDARVLIKLLAGVNIKPAGGKYGMGPRVQARRESGGQPNVFGLLDGDFQSDWRGLRGQPREWRTPLDDELLGWRWERKEIENYLVDPEVVRRALSGRAPDPAKYKSSLEAARDTIAFYTAARTALASCRVRFNDLRSSFGRKRGWEKHRFPDQTDEDACRDGIREVVADHQATQLVRPETVLDRLSELQAGFSVAGARYEDYLAAFAGKDLLWAMDDDLRELGFDGAWAFRERILVGIVQSPEDLGGWLPEWQALQDAVGAVHP